MLLTIHNSKLNQKELAEILRKQVDDFSPNMTDNFIQKYSIKWSKYAEHIYCTDSDGEIKALLIYYANQLPFIYTAHIWIAKSYRRQGYCSKLFSLAENLSYRRGGVLYHMLEVADDNIKARKTYEKLGFNMLEKRINSSILIKEIIM